jgi:RNA polymerase sigma factor (sigma-70 family)
MVPIPLIAKDNAALAAILDSLLPYISPTVGWACRQYHQYPTPDVTNDLTQEVILSLIKEDYKRLRSFEHRADGKTWLRVVVLHQVGRHFKRQRRFESLEHLSDTSLPPQRPEQDAQILSRERKELLAKVQGQLTSREQELLSCLLYGLGDEEIATCMGVQVRSIQRAKCMLFKKVRSTLQDNPINRSLNN